MVIIWKVKHVHTDRRAAFRALEKGTAALLCSYPDSDDMNMDCIAAGDEEANIVSDVWKTRRGY